MQGKGGDKRVGRNGREEPFKERGRSRPNTTRIFEPDSCRWCHSLSYTCTFSLLDRPLCLPLFLMRQSDNLKEKKNRERERAGERQGEQRRDKQPERETQKKEQRQPKARRTITERERERGKAINETNGKRVVILLRVPLSLSPPLSSCSWLFPPPLLPTPSFSSPSLAPSLFISFFLSL